MSITGYDNPSPQQPWPSYGSYAGRGYDTPGRRYGSADFGFGAGGTDGRESMQLPPVVNGDNFDPGQPDGRLTIPGATYVPPDEQSRLPPVLHGARFRRSAEGHGRRKVNPADPGTVLLAAALDSDKVPLANPYAFPDPESAGHKRVRNKRRTMLCFAMSPATRRSG